MGFKGQGALVAVNARVLPGMFERCLFPSLSHTSDLRDHAASVRAGPLHGGGGGAVREGGSAFVFSAISARTPAWPMVSLWLPRAPLLGMLPVPRAPSERAVWYQVTLTHSSSVGELGVIYDH